MRFYRALPSAGLRPRPAPCPRRSRTPRPRRVRSSSAAYRQILLHDGADRRETPRSTESPSTPATSTRRRLAMTRPALRTWSTMRRPQAEGEEDDPRPALRAGVADARPSVSTPRCSSTTCYGLPRAETAAVLGLSERGDARRCCSAPASGSVTLFEEPPSRRTRLDLPPGGDRRRERGRADDCLHGRRRAQAARARPGTAGSAAGRRRRGRSGPIGLALFLERRPLPPVAAGGPRVRDLRAPATPARARRGQGPATASTGVARLQPSTLLAVVGRALTSKTAAYVARRRLSRRLHRLGRVRLSSMSGSAGDRRSPLRRSAPRRDRTRPGRWSGVGRSQRAEHCGEQAGRQSHDRPCAHVRPRDECAQVASPALAQVALPSTSDVQSAQPRRSAGGDTSTGDGAKGDAAEGDGSRDASQVGHEEEWGSGAAVMDFGCVARRCAVFGARHGHRCSTRAGHGHSSGEAVKTTTRAWSRPFPRGEQSREHRKTEKHLENRAGRQGRESHEVDSTPTRPGRHRSHDRSHGTTGTTSPERLEERPRTSRTAESRPDSTREMQSPAQELIRSELAHLPRLVTRPRDRTRSGARPGSLAILARRRRLDRPRRRALPRGRLPPRRLRRPCRRRSPRSEQRRVRRARPQGTGARARPDAAAQPAGFRAPLCVKASPRWSSFRCKRTARCSACWSWLSRRPRTYSPDEIDTRACGRRTSWRRRSSVPWSFVGSSIASSASGSCSRPPRRSTAASTRSRSSPPSSPRRRAWCSAPKVGAARGPRRRARRAGGVRVRRQVQAALRRAARGLALRPCGPQRRDGGRRGRRIRTR